MIAIDEWEWVHSQRSISPPDQQVQNSESALIITVNLSDWNQPDKARIP
jgi:hypothetical protein